MPIAQACLWNGGIATRVHVQAAVAGAFAQDIRAARIANAMGDAARGRLILVQAAGVTHGG
jgi:hypothetical protein